MASMSLADGGGTALSVGSLLLAAFTAALGFASAYLLDLLSSRRNSKKELSWDLVTETPTLTYGATDAGQLRMTYGGRPVERLITVAHRVTNTGTERVENEFLRYQIPVDARLLDHRLEPAPPPEMAVEDLTGADPTFPGIRYKIGAIDPGQTLRVVLVADGGDWSDWIGPVDHNADRYVSFIKRDLSAKPAEEAYLARFISSLAIFAILSVLGAMLFVEFWILSRFPLDEWAYYLYATLVSSALVGLAGNLMWRAMRATRVMTVAFQRRRDQATNQVQFHVYGEGHAAYTAQGFIHVQPKSSEAV